MGSNVRRVVSGNDVHGALKTAFYHLLRRAYGETDSLAGYKNHVLLKVTGQCDYGKLDFRFALTASQTAGASVLPLLGFIDNSPSVNGAM